MNIHKKRTKKYLTFANIDTLDKYYIIYQCAQTKKKKGKEREGVCTYVRARVQDKGSR